VRFSDIANIGECALDHYSTKPDQGNYNACCQSAYFFVQSFARITLPGNLIPSYTTVTVGGHHRWITEQIKRNITPGYVPDPHQYTATLPDTPEDLVMNLILNNMIDIGNDPAVTHRRCRLEWPRRNEAIFQALEQHTDHLLPAPLKEFVTRFIKDEFSKCGCELEQRKEDHACMNELVAIPRRNNRPQY